MNENTTPTTPVEEEEHRYFYQVIADLWLEFFNFLKYIFYDLLIGNG